MSDFQHFFSRAFVVMLTISVLVLIAACGGDDETSDQATDEPTATSESEESREPSPDSGDAGAGGDTASDLGALAGEYSDFTGVVKYETTGFGGDSFTSMTIYKGSGGSRVDYESADGSGTFLTNADGSFVCAEDQCIKYPAGQGVDPTAALTAFISPDAIQEAYGDVPEGVDLDQSSETIAGIDATCYRYSGDLDEEDAGDESGTVCFSEAGILLRLEFSGASGAGKFEAVEAEEGVSESDFDPPYTVIELPGQ
jgi:hypothetical protein